MLTAKISWLLMLVISSAACAYTGNSVLAALVLLLVTAPVISLLLNIFAKKHIQCKVSCEAGVRKGDDGFITLEVSNDTLIPVLRTRCCIEAVNQLNKEKQLLEVVMWNPPKSKKRTTLRYRNDYCGRTRIEVKTITIYDCFGLIGIRCKGNAVCYMTVQPDTFETSVTLRLLENGSDDSDLYSQERAGNDLTETFQIREYVQGDSQRQIHWKLSSKFDRLIVRDAALPIVRSVLVFWERTGGSDNPERIDAQAETIVSLCKGLIDASMQFTVGWNDTDRNICIMHEIHDMDELVAVIPRLLRATGSKDSLSGAGLLVQTRSDALCAHMVYIAEEPQQEVDDMCRYGNVTMMLCGETYLDGAVMFDETSYRETLTQIEI